MRVGVCLIVRNEESDIAEWVIYHALIGFNAFIIYENGSDDRTPQVLDRLRRLYNIKIIAWPRATKLSQIEAYDDCLKNFRDDFDWIAFIDADEFIAPKRDKNIASFLTYHEDADAVSLNWAVFGSSGHVAAPDGLVIENFALRAVRDFGANRHTKMIVRPAKVTHVIDPHSIVVEGRTAHADGSDLVRRPDRSSNTTAGFDICRVNHYFVRSRTHWDAKMKRGYRDIVRPDADRNFHLHDTNDVSDTWAAEHGPAVRETLAALNLLPLRPQIGGGADDVMYRVPAGNEDDLFDANLYLHLYPDIRAAGVDPLFHWRHNGRDEGRRPCTRQRVLDYLAAFGARPT